MEEKKTEVITFRTDSTVKEDLQRIAKTNKWSIAQTVNQLCINYLINPKPNTITIKTDDLIKQAIEIRQEGLDKGVEISIDLVWDEKRQEYKKELYFQVIECGGLGVIGDFDTIAEMTEEEILNIP